MTVCRVNGRTFQLVQPGLLYPLLAKYDPSYNQPSICTDGQFKVEIDELTLFSPDINLLVAMLRDISTLASNQIVAAKYTIYERCDGCWIPFNFIDLFPKSFDYQDVNKKLGYPTACLAEGAFGQVVVTDTGSVVKALKNPEYFESIPEILVYKLLQLHQLPNVLTPTTIVYNLPYVWTQFPRGVSMVQYLLARPDYHNVYKYAHQFVSGIYQLHSIGILHQDIKPDNCVIVDSNLKIIDMSLARPWTTVPCEGTFYSPEYRSPEAWDGQFGPAAESWAVGCTLYYLFTNRHLIMDLNNCNCANDCRRQSPAFEWSDYRKQFQKAAYILPVPDVFIDLLTKIFCPAATRLTVDQILTHRFFNTVVPPVAPRTSAPRSCTHPLTTPDLKGYLVTDHIIEHYRAILLSEYDQITDTHQVIMTILSVYLYLIIYVGSTNVRLGRLAASFGYDGPISSYLRWAVSHPDLHFF